MVFPVLLVVNVLNEVDFQRYSNIFGAYLNMVQSGHISPEYKTFPLFDSSFTADPTLSPIAQRISETESFFPNIVIIHLILVYITGISPEMSIIFPFGLVMVPIAYIGLLNSLLNRKKYPFVFMLLSIYGILFLFTTKSTSSFYAATPSYILLFASIMCIWKYVIAHDIRYYLIIIILLISLAHYWHTMLMAVMILLLCIWLVFYGIKIIRKIKPNILYGDVSLNKSAESNLNSNYLRNIGTLAIISIVIAITFTHLWQSSYIDEFSQNANITDFIQEAIKKLTGDIAFEVPYQYNYKSTMIGMLYYISYLSILIISLVMALWIIFSSFIKDENNKTLHRKIDAHKSIVLLSALILAQIVNVFLYYRTNSINLFYVPLLFPMVATYAYVSINDKKIKNKKLIVGPLITLIILSSICLFSIYSTNQAGETSVTKYADVESSFHWTYSHIDGESQRTYADFNVLGKSLQYESKTNKPSFNYEYMTPRIYAVLVGDELIPDTIKGQYIIVDHETMNAGLPIQIPDSRAALAPLMTEICYSSNVGKIYQDSHISIYKIND